MKYIYIVGNSRSGTNLISRALGNHDSILTLSELHFFEGLLTKNEIKNTSSWSRNNLINLLEKLFIRSEPFQGFYSKKSRKYVELSYKIVNSLDVLDPILAYKEFIKYKLSTFSKKTIYCEQTPRYLFYSKDIFNNFENVFIINMIRDPRDILLSQKNKWKIRFRGNRNIPLNEVARSWANYHPIITSYIWKSCILESYKYKKNKHFINIKYEELINDPENILKELCNITKIKFDSNMLDVKHFGSSNKVNQKDTFGFDISRISNWEKNLNDGEVYLTQKINEKEMDLNSYSKKKINTPIITLIFYFLIFFPQLLLILILNLKRNKSVLSSIKSRFLNLWK
jgi:omega-hydroxy-beta-dihydromenaquinone-9 sulfotransferase